MKPNLYTYVIIHNFSTLTRKTSCFPDFAKDPVAPWKLSTPRTLTSIAAYTPEHLKNK